MQHEFRSRCFRLYLTEDVVGVELGGALKNVIAIAAGVVESTGLGHNAMAALLTRGLAEISRLAIAMGGRRDTLAGLSGLGDLVLTCTGHLSRNRQVGIELGRGRPLADILTGMRMVAEGVRTTTAALELGARHGIELPITAQMASLLAGEKSPARGGRRADAPSATRGSLSGAGGPHRLASPRKCKPLSSGRGGGEGLLPSATMDGSDGPVFSPQRVAFSAPKSSSFNVSKRSSGRRTRPRRGRGRLMSIRSTRSKKS